MDTINIGGIEREIVLKKHVVDKYIKMFNLYYAKQTRKMKMFETKRLVEIGKEQDEDRKIQMVDEYVKQVESAYNNIEFPFFLVYDILWNILTDAERKRFKKKKNEMIRSILVDELDDLVTFVGARVLRLAGYNKKKV